MSEERPQALSGGPLGELEVPAADAPGYELGGLLGRGGMGEVHIARDRQLGRDVALKTPRPGDPGAAAHLAREARLTALLEHPNIVPIYGVGRDGAGSPWCAMRLLPGRSLAEALREDPNRLRLVRHLLDAAEAIAYAHGRGVLHRDLKPSNIMVGGFGETVVTDWGLACTLEEAAGVPPNAGTPGYMSPEQRRGGAIDGRADVYGLGAVLFELLTGEAPPPDGAGGPVRAAAPEAPPELAAIAERALAQDPAERYPSVRALADDLLAWYEGRRVAAHDYTVRELLLRQLERWKLPIAIGAIGAVALVVAVGVGWYRNSMERARAQASEQRALAASASAQRALAEALLAQALTAAGEDNRMEAEIFAVNALAITPSPEGRGVIARFGGRPRLAIAGEAVSLPSCVRRALSPDGKWWLCGRDDWVGLFDLARPERPIAEATGPFRALSFDGSGELVVMIDQDGLPYVWDGRGPPRAFDEEPMAIPTFDHTNQPGLVAAVVRSGDTVFDLRSRTTWRRHSCEQGTSATHVGVRAGGGTLVGCSNFEVLLLDPAGRIEQRIPIDPEDGTPFSAVELPDGRLLVGSVKGRLLVFSPGGELLHRRDVGSDVLTQFTVSGDKVAMRTGHGDVVVWSSSTLQVLARHMANGSMLAWVGTEPRLRFVADTLEDRTIPLGYRPHLIPLGVGIGCVAISPNGLLAASGHGDGTVHLVSLVTGDILRRWHWQDGVVKDVAFSPDGRWLAVATATDEQRVIELATDALVRSFSDLRSKRVVWWRSGWLMFAPYYHYLPMWKDIRREDPEVRVEAAFGEIEMSADLRRAALLDELDNLWRMEDGDPPKLYFVGIGRRAFSGAPIGTDTLVATEDGVLRYDATGRIISRFAVDGTVVEIAVSPDERLIAFGHLNGKISIWTHDNPAAPLAKLSGHSARPSSLAFAPDGQWLLSGGWDGELRVWSLGELEVETGALRDQVMRDWGVSLESTLAGVN